jgi:hypothetical protein
MGQDIIRLRGMNLMIEMMRMLAQDRQQITERRALTQATLQKIEVMKSRLKRKRNAEGHDIVQLVIAGVAKDAQRELLHLEEQDKIVDLATKILDEYEMAGETSINSLLANIAKDKQGTAELLSFLNP